MVSDAIPVAADVTGRTGSVMMEGMAAGRHGNRLGGAARSSSCNGDSNTTRELVLVWW
jgi:hypothetical protein